MATGSDGGTQAGRALVALTLLLGCGDADCRVVEHVVESNAECWVGAVSDRYSIGTSDSECAPEARCVVVHGPGKVYIYAPGHESQKVRYDFTPTCEVECMPIRFFPK